jgi:excisionase family DNA binding protein
MREALITTAEAAAILHTVPDNVRSLARRGQLPIAATVGRGQRLFDRAVVEQLAQKRQQRLTQKASAA